MPRNALLAGITVVASTLVALIIGELFLVVYSSGQADREHMDPGLIRYHAHYGWNLTPGWQGHHTHPDYDVSYRVDPIGFRQGCHTGSRVQPYVVVGDSFSFGLGVADNETFACLLEEKTGERILNAAVPGYSPEQAFLKAIDLVGRHRPRGVLFVVYLGNDLVDLGLPFPVQADYAKPYAMIEGGDWQLANQPVPQVPKPDPMKRDTLATYIIKPGTSSWLASRRLGQLLLENGLVTNPAQLDEARIDNAVQLMRGILERLHAVAPGNAVMVLLPGSGLVNRPGSLAARYQQAVGVRLEALAKEIGMPTVSLVDTLIQAAEEATLYHPLDGHLTVRGHQVVAEALAAAL